MDKLGRRLDAIRAYDLLVSALGDHSDPHLEDYVATARMRGAVLAAREGGREEAERRFADFWDRHNRTRDEETALRVVIGTVARAWNLKALGRESEGIQRLRDMLDQFASFPSQHVQGWVMDYTATIVTLEGPESERISDEEMERWREHCDF